MLLHQVEAHFRIVEDRRVDALRASPQLFLLVADRLGEFGFGDLAAVEFRDFADAAAAAEVVVDAEERERNHDQRQNELRDPFVLVHEDQTSPGPVLSSPRIDRAGACATAAGDVRLPARRLRPDAKRANSRSPFELAEWTGLEPATPGVTGRYSNQLNYHSRLRAGSRPVHLVGADGIEPPTFAL